MAARQTHIERLFNRWGGATVFLSRTLVSHLNLAVNLHMSASRYRLSRFVAITLAGRLIWTSAYLGLGYSIGTDLEAASSFLRDAESVSGFGRGSRRPRVRPAR